MKKLIILSTLFVGTTFSTFAQKIATVNSQELLYAMPETKAMQGKLEAKTTELQKQSETMMKTYEAKVTEFNKNKATMMESIAESKQLEIIDLEKRIQKFEESAQGELQKLEQTLTAPILQKAKQTIDQVAKILGYTHVFDVSSGSLLVFPEGDDITGKVKSKMGIVDAPKTVAPSPSGGK